jgi:hypothetical protein
VFDKRTGFVTRKHQIRLRGGGICMSTTTNVRVAPLEDTRPPDVAQAAAAAEGASARAAAAADEARASAAAEEEEARASAEVALEEKARASAAAVTAAQSAYEARQIRLQQASDQRLQLDVSATPLCPLHGRIGHDMERRDRPGWKERLEANFELALRERHIATDLGVLCGDLDGPVKHFVMREERRIVSFLLSSTFTDTEWERNLIIADVVPYLQDLARRLGFEFRLAEMRWGIREAASSAHQTSEICMAELERCQRESQGFSYVFLG